MTKTNRRFGIADLISLVSAFSIAFSVCIFVERRWKIADTTWNTVNSISAIWTYAGYVLITLTFYQCAMILRRKPSRGDIIQSRGRACITVICVVALLDSLTSWDLFFYPDLAAEAKFLLLPFSIISSPTTAAGASLCAWQALNLASVPKSQTDWLDRYGKITCFVWLLFAIAQPLLSIPVLKALGVPMQ